MLTAMIDAFRGFLHCMWWILIDGMFISVLTIALVKLLLKNKISTDLSIQIMRWIILVSAFCNLFILIALLTDPPENSLFLNRLTGESWAYRIMLFSSSILPLLLLNKKLGRKIVILFLIALMMNIGRLFELIVIHIPSIFRGDDGAYLPYPTELFILIKGLIIAAVLLLIENEIKKRNKITVE